MRHCYYADGELVYSDGIPLDGHRNRIARREIILQPLDEAMLGVEVCIFKHERLRIAEHLRDGSAGDSPVTPGDNWPRADHLD